MAKKRLATAAISCSVQNCVQIFSCEKGLQSHMAHVHRNLLPHQCELCKMGFQDEQKLHDHLKRHDGEMYQCDKKECRGKRFSNEKLLAKHVAEQHAHKRVLYKCDICDKKFRQKKFLKRHVVHFHEEDGSACRSCGKWLKTDSIRRLHEDWHFRIKSNRLFKCHLCSYSNCHASHLRAHVREVHGPPQFGCQLCDKKFRSISGVVKHRNSLLHLSNLERLGLVDIWRMKEERWGGLKWSGGTYLEWGKMNQFVSKEEAARIIKEEEKNTTVLTNGI